ncbi:ABC transporter G family member 11 [Corchorus olitorius]|uniref:ABC transporter G family member 11 n=1 Tax=Corchorus olitorius TaxID=93759 RepID=A0A1R3JH66_9ROSI|nr:ABC transporter G family member 11 [Corchorus olitorius]
MTVEGISSFLYDVRMFGRCRLNSCVHPDQST